MKRIICFLSIVLSCIVLNSCNPSISNISGIDTTVSTTNEIDNTVYDIVKKEKNFEVAYINIRNLKVFHYFVYNNNGEILVDDYLAIKPDFTYLSDDILQLHYGSSGLVSQYQFFNCKEGLISSIYENPALINGVKAVYMTYDDLKLKLVIRDLFDSDKYLKEYVRDFSPVAEPYGALLKAEFIDIDSLQITYLSGKDYIEVTEIINLE